MRRHLQHNSERRQKRRHRRHCDDTVTTSFANDDDTDIGTVTVNLGDARPGAEAFGFVVLRGVRADVSGLSAGDKIVASINSSTAPTGFVPIGQERTESVGGTVSTVKSGLDVVLGSASRLLCNLGDHEPMTRRHG